MKAILKFVHEYLNRQKIIIEQNEFIINEIHKINKLFRSQLFHEVKKMESDQTKKSFDWQWSKFNEGIAMPNDKTFMENLTTYICNITGLSADWFYKKRIIDIGCGVGRFTYGLLSLGAKVLACDQSPSALKRTKDLCKSFKNNVSFEKVDLLKWDKKYEYDLAFSFGVVHHTGNTYLAIRNVANKVKNGGKIFLMVYGYPEKHDDFIALNLYERLRKELRNMPFEEKKNILIDRYGEHNAHGWFDAISPAINDLLTFHELEDLLSNLGYSNIKRTVEHRNLHIVADKNI